MIELSGLIVCIVLPCQFPTFRGINGPAASAGAESIKDNIAAVMSTGYPHDYTFFRPVTPLSAQGSSDPVI